MDKLLSMWNLPSSLNDLDPWSINELGNFTGLFVWQPAISLIFESFLYLKTNFHQNPKLHKYFASKPHPEVALWIIY